MGIRWLVALGANHRLFRASLLVLLLAGATYGGWHLAQPRPSPALAARMQEKRRLKAHLLADPEDERAWRSIGRLSFDNGDMQRAIIYLKTALQLDPDDWEAWYSLSRAYQRRGQPGDTERTREATERSSGLRNTAMRRREITDRAAIFSSDPAAQEAAARACLEQNRLSEALTYLARYVKLRPDDTAAREQRDLLARKLAQDRGEAP